MTARNQPQNNAEELSMSDFKVCSLTRNNRRSIFDRVVESSGSDGAEGVEGYDLPDLLRGPVARGAPEGTAGVDLRFLAVVCVAYLGDGGACYDSHAIRDPGDVREIVDGRCYGDVTPIIPWLRSTRFKGLHYTTASL